MADSETAALEAELAALNAALDQPTSMAQGPFYTPVPAAPAPDQLQSLINQPTRAPSEVELGVARLRAMSPLEQAIADLGGRKLLFQEGLSLGVLPKVGAAATSLKEALYGKPITEAFGEAVTQQDILKEFVRQKDLEQNDLVLGVSTPELAGGILSPIGRLYTPAKVAVGAPLRTALATRALNVGKATGTGAGAAGLQTFLSTPGTVEERLAAAGESAQTGAMFGGGFGALGEVVGQATPKLQSLGKGARRSALGATQTDYLKTAGKRNFVPKEDDVYTLTEQGLDNVIEKNYLGDSFDPLSQSEHLDASIRSLENELDAKIAQVEKAKDSTVKTPQFVSLARDVQLGKFGGINREQYAAKLAKIKADISQQRNNKLQYLQEQKKYYGTLYEPTGNSADARFNRAIYHELQAAVEKYVPEARSLNEDVQSLILTRPIIDRRKAAASASANKLFSALARSTYTTGGLFGAGLRSAGAGPLASIALAAGTRGAATPTGRELIGRALTGSSLGDSLTAIGLRAGQVMSRPDIEPILQAEPERKGKDEEELALEAELESLNQATPEEIIKIGKQNISIPQGEDYAPADLVKAVMQVESSGKPNAVSEKGAAGLMQLMPGTAKDLGVEDRFDPEQNIDGGSRYLAQQLKEFGSPELALAAYNWGPDRIANAIKKLKAEGKKPTWENVKGVVKVPQETREYVEKVLGRITVDPKADEFLRKYDHHDLAKIARIVGSKKLDAALKKYPAGKSFTIGRILDDLGLDSSTVGVKRSNTWGTEAKLVEA